MSYALKTKLRRLTAALTAFVLAFSLAPATAFASWGSFTDSSDQTITGSISVSGVDATYHNIYVYQVAETQVNSETNATQWIAVNDDNSGSLASAVSAWIDADGSTTTAETLKSLIQDDSLGTLVASYVNGSSTSSLSNSVSISGTTASVSNLDPGIYVVLVENNTAGAASSTWGSKIYQTMVLSINVAADGTEDWQLANDGKNASALKSFESSIEKSILIDSTNDYYVSGDTLTFQLAVTIPTSDSVTYFYVEDLLTGLEYVDNTLAVYSDEPTVSDASVTGTQTSSGSYTLYTSATTHDAAVSGHSFNSTAGTGREVLHIDFDSTFLSTYAGQTVYIVYQAKITDDGITSGAKNEVTSSAIVDSGNKEPGGGDEVAVAYALEIFAYYLNGSDEVGLQGATFAVYTDTVYEASLSTDQDTGVTSSSLYSSSTGWDTANALVIAANNGKTITTGTDGKATTTYALKANTEYYVVETVVPSGYVMPTLGKSFTIDPTDTTNFTSGSNVWSISIEQTATDGNDPGTGFEGSGINLPATGGLGTILLTAVGVLIIAAGACYTLRARKQQRRQQG